MTRVPIELTKEMMTYIEGCLCKGTKVTAAYLVGDRRRKYEVHYIDPINGECKSTFSPRRMRTGQGAHIK